MPEHTERLRSAMTELSEQIAAYYPTIPEIAPQQLSNELVDDLPAHLLRNMPGVVVDDDHQHPELNKVRLFILMPECHPFVAVARKENPMAQWGIGIPRVFSAAWVDNKYLWWHEALHLFNAKDCYNRFGVNKCPEPKCVMQVSPTSRSCGNRLHLCSKNVHRISTHDPDY